MDYSPPTANPDHGVEATPEDIRNDLQALRQANFTGLITYGTNGMLGKQLLAVAKDLGFSGVIIGVWNPQNAAELAAAKEAAQSPLVVGLCIGNEGLMNKRYSFDELSAAVKEIREATKKPVTTTEVVDRYDGRLLRLGDWVFPNAHPYFSKVFEPKAAVDWTRARFNEIKKRTEQFVMFKEVGLPTAGDPDHPLSEKAQCVYYDQLRKSVVHFAYFEAFDVPWKTALPVEPHWGIFHADRTPKVLARHLIAGTACQTSLAQAQSGPAPLQTSPAAVPVTGDSYYIYRGNTSQHFIPADRMGDVGDVQMDQNWQQGPCAGSSCIRFNYTPRGRDPQCAPDAKCGWAGVLWQSPPRNRGQSPTGGQNLSRFKLLRFSARADASARVEFVVGGVSGPFGDSLNDGKRYLATLGPEWKEYTIDLSDANLQYIITGFGWSASKELNPIGSVFYLRDIRYEVGPK